MISSLWIAKTGLDAQQTNMDVIANNLANVSTNGFKRQRAVFEDLLYQTIRQPGAQSSEQTTLPSGLQIGTGVRPVATERLHSQGNLSQTNNSKDVAIKGQGFFQVMLPDGSSARIIDGLLINALATATLCCSPPESSFGLWFNLSSNPKNVSNSFALEIASFCGVLAM